VFKKIPWLQGIEKKQKPTQEKVPNNLLQRVIPVLIWGFLLILLGSSIVFLFRFGQLTTTNKLLTQKVAALEEKTEQIQLNNQQSDNLDVFGRYFVQRYYNTSSKPEEYKKSLSGYFSKGIELPIITEGTRKKEIKSIQLWAKEWDGTAYHCAYLVQYSFPDGEKTHLGSELIHFQVKENKGAYGVVTYPYVEQVGEFTTTSVEKIQDPLEKSGESISEETMKSISTWLNDTFFPRYFESTNVDDISYMMKKPVLLGNIQKYESIETIRVYKDGSQWLVKTTVIVSDRLTRVKSKQEYSLLLKEEEKKYVVEKMTHTLGGKKENETN
jgi:hypothetical protein